MKKTTIKRRISFHWIRDDELEAVQDIASACFAEVGLVAAGESRIPKWSIGLPLWDLRVLTEYLETKDRFAKVMTVNREVVGYLFYSLKEHVVVIDQITVDPEHWRKGYAGRMMQKLKDTMPELRLQIVAARVSEMNLGTQLFLRESGFRWIRTLKGSPSAEDFYLMRWKEMTA
ncbi:MAG: GNAT family N-acetyltransferase [Planctomycetales bacterium]|nr:GNAT family N-acetyltransferase [Planctomycetales bacterium]